ncbi:hypothetical protein HDU98_009991 [Podochytrium sp. JEL0797]|nr:hypothetical protein HDU98_009991 [Podochytrium sp. JEL0797]
MVPWRRAHMSNLVNAFDFQNPNFTIPTVPVAPAPHKNILGKYDGSTWCQFLHPITKPAVPYSSQIAPNAVSTMSENGFKKVRGALTEGRYLTFEANGVALANVLTGSVATTATTAAHDAFIQRWILHVIALGGNTFQIQSAADSRYIGVGATLGALAAADTFTITFQAGSGYALQGTAGNYLALNGAGAVVASQSIFYFSVFSVTYQNKTVVLP